MKVGKWSSKEIAYLRSHVGKQRQAAMAAALRRPLGAVKAYCSAHGINRVRRFTAAEVAYVKAHQGDTAGAIAAKLGRGAHSIWAIRKRAGIARKQASFGADFVAFVRKQNAAGWTDSEIARAWNCDRHAVSRRRRLLGLADNTLSEHRRRCVAEKTRQQVQAAGAKSLSEIRCRAFRVYARKYGWPEDLRPREVQVLNALLRHGPQTRRQIADRIGMPWKGSKKSLVGNVEGGSYLAHLKRRGLVVSLGRVVKGKGRGHSTQLYSISLWTERSAG